MHSSFSIRADRIYQVCGQLCSQTNVWSKPYCMSGVHASILGNITFFHCGVRDTHAIPRGSGCSLWQNTGACPERSYFCGPNRGQGDFAFFLDVSWFLRTPETLLKMPLLWPVLGTIRAVWEWEATHMSTQAWAHEDLNHSGIIPSVVSLQRLVKRQ